MEFCVSIVGLLINIQYRAIKSLCDVKLDGPTCKRFCSAAEGQAYALVGGSKAWAGL